MPKSLTDALKGVPLAMCALAAMAAPWSQVQAGKAIDERRAADPQGEVEIVNVSGSVQVDGWDRNEVEVGGTAGDSIDRVEVTGAGNRTSIHVVSHTVHRWGADGEARLIIHVPARSALTVSLVSADFKTTGVQGDLKLQSVSGSVSGDVGGDVHASTVSGDLSFKFAAAPAAEFDVQSFSGDIKNCFGPKAAQAHFGPGSRLQSANGSSHAHVQIATKSGDVRLCTKGSSAAAGAAGGAQMRVAQAGRSPLRVPYVY